MQTFRCLVIAGLVASSGVAGARASCTDSDDFLGVSRVVEIDTKDGPLYGSITKFRSQKSFLRDKEVVLTFDDGPSPKTTQKILDALDRFCTKATFFYVGKMALAHPQTLRTVLSKGHTVGSHTWSHARLQHISQFAAIDEIERGMAAVTLAAGQPIAPFFRFTGLNDTRALLQHLQDRQVASFSVDIVTDDSFIAHAGGVTKMTMRRLKTHGKGILLFHDIKTQTAQAMPDILRALKTGGYRVVHVRATAPLVANSKILAGLKLRYKHLTASDRVAGPPREMRTRYFKAPGKPAPVVTLTPPRLAYGTGAGSRMTSPRDKAAAPILSGWATSIRAAPARGRSTH